MEKHAGVGGERRRRPAIPLWLRLVRFVDRGTAVFNRHLRAYDLNLAQFDVIAQVGRTRGLTQRELADRLVVTPGNITQLLGKMETRGLVTRVAEGRCNRVGLTERGRELYRTVVPEHEALIAGLFDHLAPAEMQTLQKLAKKLLDRADRAPSA